MSGYNHYPPYPPCPPPPYCQPETECLFGKVEQENEAYVDQAAYINQQLEQNNVFVVLCGDGGSYPGLTFNPKDNMSLTFDNTGNVVINGKPIEGKEVADGLKMYILREKKIKNQSFGNSSPEEVMERVMGFDQENKQQEDDDDEGWEFF